ncbi:MAG: inosine/xanthosine triphosphatase [candidate division KSB1 bacterium]|nr:inosine/xanthosine triphosphatase [candidate division KSB1 bacterium]MDZ7301936.1 inosine/xanthosine triphosphatase [candidate division KSB1 bacterium]MDZ7312341.1 inosine/xanthosine triphosphatase [candidate division KSB1 bacterium]
MSENILKVAIGSLRPPKVDAVRTVMSKVMGFLGYWPEAISYIAREVESGVSPMPLSVQEIRRGACNRAMEVRRIVEAESGPVDFAIGLEGGFFILSAEDREHIHLQTWAFVHHQGKGYYGSSMSMPVPQAVAHEVLKNKKDLGEVIDNFAERKGVRDQDGAFGVFSLGLLTRQQAMELALIGALAPFYHKKLYQNT